ncbi:NTE family protein [Caloranaerobacter azorensis DSM 13643]|uniref:NTE family protein n=1 Tax=Caloranaerobacter azorensis DSM 13643 TaxID=1121264 RepID=A0A1M5RQ19_9FIRM|nr:NTE family protein [Caloranaerobacter azorensis DSM 13643]
MKSLVEKRKIGLALGSGAARGLAHIGVLKAFEENGIEVDIVSGSSAGALIGAIYCCGVKPKMIENIALNIDRKLWIDLTVPKRGFVKGKKVEELVKLLTGNRNIEDLNKKLFIVATDLKTSSEYIFTEGPIYRAVRASISIPGIFEPVKHGDMILVDGGVIDRVPATVVRDMGADIVIAVDVGFSGEPGRINHVFDVILQSIDVMSRQISTNKIISADIVIEPDVSHIKSSRFDKVEECVIKGYEAAMEKMEEIKRVIDGK